MTKKESSGTKVTRTASSVHRDSGASKIAQTLAGSALAQAHTSKVSSSTTAKVAAKALNDGRTSAVTRTLAGSVLTQRPGGGKNR